jgi:hypothetical protein
MDHDAIMSHADPHGEPLDRLLAQAISPPPLPEGFAAHVRAAVARADAERPVSKLCAAEHDWLSMQASLRSGQRRLAWSAVSLVVGTTIGAAACLVNAATWMQAIYGDDGLLLLPWIGIAVGAVVAGPWRRTIGSIVI